MKNLPLWLQTILVAIFVIPLVYFASTANWQEDNAQNIDEPADTTIAEASTTTTPPSAELIDGVSVVFESQRNVFRNDDVRRNIAQAISLLPDALADEIRGTTIYVVDNPTRCASSSLPPGFVVAGCTDGVSAEFIELILNNNGYSLYVIVHEFGHVIGGHLTPWGTQRYASYFNSIYVAGSGDSPPTKYGERYFKEDYADSFALYVLNQDKLRRCCDDRYEYFNELFEGQKPV